MPGPHVRPFFLGALFSSSSPSSLGTTQLRPQVLLLSPGVTVNNKGRMGAGKQRGPPKLASPRPDMHSHITGAAGDSQTLSKTQCPSGACQVSKGVPSQHSLSAFKVPNVRKPPRFSRVQHKVGTQASQSPELQADLTPGTCFVAGDWLGGGGEVAGEEVGER